MENPFKLNFDKQNEKKYKKCIACNYLMAETLDICPNCNFDNSGKVVESPKDRTISFDQFHYSKDVGFKLMPHNSDGKFLNFKGESIVLNRENVGPQDMSISGDNHAVISKVDGRWYIENKSSNEATFIRVEGRVEIKDGAVIILGQSKVFTFLDNQESKA